MLCSGQSASKIGAFINNLQSLSIHCDGLLTVGLFRCWLVHYFSLFRADCEIITVTGFFSVLAFFAIAKRSSSSTSVCTLDLVCNLLRLSSLPSKRYLIGKPFIVHVSFNGLSYHETVFRRHVLLNRVSARIPDEYSNASKTLTDTII